MSRVINAMLCGLLSICAALSAHAQNEDAARGEKIYQTWCASCHAGGIGNPGFSMKPGTGALRAKYEGRVPPILSERTDLTPQFIAVFVRQGISVMPFFRKTEISDQDLADLGAYLSRNRN